jgi:hypothetical protein
MARTGNTPELAAPRRLSSGGYALLVTPFVLALVVVVSGTGSASCCNLSCWPRVDLLQAAWAQQCRLAGRSPERRADSGCPGRHQSGRLVAAAYDADRGRPRRGRLRRWLGRPHPGSRCGPARDRWSAGPGGCRHRGRHRPELDRHRSHREKGAAAGDLGVRPRALERQGHGRRPHRRANSTPAESERRPAYPHLALLATVVRPGTELPLDARAAGRRVLDIGPHRSFTAPASGELLLGVNDTGTGNNRGWFGATVRR